MGVSIHVGDIGTLVFAHPNVLGAQWQLKMDIPFQSFWAMTQRQVGNTFMSALCNTFPFVSVWGGFLVSVTAWMQLAVLSQYLSHIARAAMPI